MRHDVGGWQVLCDSACVETVCSDDILKVIPDTLYVHI
jgi:hypothetical protein